MVIVVAAPRFDDAMAAQEKRATSWFSAVGSTASTSRTSLQSGIAGSTSASPWERDVGSGRADAGVTTTEFVRGVVNRAAEEVLATAYARE
jgi:hypothetical protein